MQTDWYDWVRAFHIIFMVTWFAGLFYLPRLFVYHCETNDATGHGRFCTMERRLFRLMTIGALGTLGLGLWLWLGGVGLPGPRWLHLKFSLALALLIYHGWLYLIYKDFANYRNKRTARFYRYINELPAFFLIAMVLLAVLKPF